MYRKLACRSLFANESLPGDLNDDHKQLTFSTSWPVLPFRRHYPRGQNAILPLPHHMRQGSREAKFSVLSLCLSDNKNPVSLLLVFNLRCWSNYGKVGGGQTVSVMKGGCMWKGIIQHELDHALGFLHEHSRSDRDRYVRIMWEYISPGKCF